MLINLWNAFVKITAYPVQLPVFRTKVYYEDKKVQSRRIRGAAILISNHTSVWDYAVWLFVFFFRTLRAQMAEVLFEKKPLGLFLKMMGGVRVDRNSFDFGFVSRSQAILEKGGVVEIFPESRLPLKGIPTAPTSAKSAPASSSASRSMPASWRTTACPKRKTSSGFPRSYGKKLSVWRSNCMSKPTKAKLFSPRCFVMDFIRVSGALPGLLWLRPKIRYTSKKAKKRLRGGALLISNHVSFVDPGYTMYVIWYRRQYFVCHQAFMETKAGPFFHAAGCLIPIDADNFNIGSFRTITDSLKEGKLVTLFPEGHVNSGEMLEFKSGMVLISMQSKCPIVPIYLKPRKHWWSRLKAVVDEPVDITEMYGGMPAFSKIKEVTALLQEREARMAELAKTL